MSTENSLILDPAFRTILITGGAGFIGSKLARRLVSDGRRVRILDSLIEQVHGKSPQLDLSGCETFWEDVRDPSSVMRAMKDVDVVFHLAAETGVGQSQYEIGRYVSTNTYGTAEVLEAAVAERVKQVVIASSRAVYGEGQYLCEQCRFVFVPEGRSPDDMDAGRWGFTCPNCNGLAQQLPMTEEAPPSPTSIYGVTKLQQEQLASVVGRTNDLPVTIFRFFNVFGPGQSLRNPYVGVLGTFFRRVLANSTVEVYEDGEMLRDFVFVDDVVEILRRSIGNQSSYGRTLNVGTGVGITLLELARTVFAVLERDPKITISGRYRVGDIRHAVASVSQLESAMGTVSWTPVLSGIKSYVAWARENPSEASDDTAEQQLASKNLFRQGAR